MVHSGRNARLFGSVCCGAVPSETPQEEHCWLPATQEAQKLLNFFALVNVFCSNSVKG